MMIYPAGHTTVTATGTIKASSGSLTSIVFTGGVDAATLTLYDNSSAGSGVVMCVVNAAINTTTTVNFSYPLAFSNGLYAVITGTTPSASIGYV